MGLEETARSILARNAKTRLDASTETGALVNALTNQDWDYFDEYLRERTEYGESIGSEVPGQTGEAGTVDSP